MAPTSKLPTHSHKGPDYAPIEEEQQWSSHDLTEKDSLDSDIPLIEKPAAHGRNRSWFKRLKEKMRRLPMPSKMAMANLFLVQLLVTCLFYIWRQKTELNGLLKAVSLYSPLLNRVDVPLVPRQSFAQYGMGGPEIWRSEPSEDVDKAWEHLIAEHLFPVKHSEIVAMRKDPSEVVPMPLGYEIDGEKTYMGKAAAYHNIHCLDWVRRAIYKNHYYPNGTDDVAFYDYHTAHCLMILLEHLTCYGDTGVYLYRWMEHFDRPIADTNIWRKCWDFETVLEAHNDMTVTNMVETDVKKPKGVKEVEAPWQILKIIELFRETHPDYNPH